MAQYKYPHQTDFTYSKELHRLRRESPYVVTGFQLKSEGLACTSDHEMGTDVGM